jgi:hypothetical protein
VKNLNPKYAIWTILLVSVGIYLIYLFIFPIPDQTLKAYLIRLPTVVTVDLILFLLFDVWLWKCKLFHFWLVPFPNLNGTWKGIIKSNWKDEEESAQYLQIPVMLTIKQTFTYISCVMRTAEMRSQSFNEGFIIDRKNQVLKLSYSYESVPDQTIRNRSAKHIGSIYLDIMKDKNEMSLTGSYWTDRETTGSISLNFWKRERIEKIPEDFENHPMNK